MVDLAWCSGSVIDCQATAWDSIPGGNGVKTKRLYKKQNINKEKEKQIMHALLRNEHQSEFEILYSINIFSCIYFSLTLFLMRIHTITHLETVL